MIVRLDIEHTSTETCAYRVSADSDLLYDDEGLESIEDALVAAIEGLPPEVIAIELAYAGIVSGTYPLNVVAMNLEQVATHALNTAAAIREASTR